MSRSKFPFTVLFVCLLTGVSCNPLGQHFQTTANSNGRTAGGTTTGQDQGGYLMSSDSSILFVQWTKVDRTLNGQLQMFAIEGQNKRTYATSTHAFTGVNDNGKTSLNFTGSSWTDSLGGKTWTGSLRDNELTLVVPSKDGTLVTVKFIAATVEDYNQAVFALKNQAQRTNQELQQQRAAAAQELQQRREAAAQLEAQQQAIRQQQQAVANADQRVASLVANLQSQTKALYGAAKVDYFISQFTRSLEQMQATVNRLKETAAETPLTASKLRQVESILRQVESNKLQVESNVRAMESAVRGIENNIRPVVDGISYLRVGWDELKRAGVNNPSNTPAVRFSEPDIAQQEKAAEAAIVKAKQVSEGGLRQAKTFDNQAQRILDSARDFVRKLRVVE